MDAEMTSKLIAVIVLLSIVSATAFAQVSLTGQVSTSGATQFAKTPPVPASFFGMIVGSYPDMPPRFPSGSFVLG